ncbi:MAG: Fic family protein, partial [Bacteroidota bacterium]
MLQKYYEGTTKIINLSTEVGRLLGIVDATHLRKPKTELRKKNKVKTIRASLAIEGNTLSEEQITAILENKRVIGPAKDILE